MVDTREESRRGIAQSIAVRGLPFSAFKSAEDYKQAREWITNAIEAALNARDERAAKIVNEARFEGERDLRSLAHAIRNGDTNA